MVRWVGGLVGGSMQPARLLEIFAIMIYTFCILYITIYIACVLLCALCGRAADKMTAGKRNIKSGRDENEFNQHIII